MHSIIGIQWNAVCNLFSPQYTWSLNIWPSKRILIHSNEIHLVEWVQENFSLESCDFMEIMCPHTSACLSRVKNMLAMYLATQAPVVATIYMELKHLTFKTHPHSLQWNSPRHIPFSNRNPMKCMWENSIQLQESNEIHVDTFLNKPQYN
jgi:hypothetical protein